MTQQNSQPSADYLHSLSKTARRLPALWLLPVIVALLIAVLFGFLGPKMWDASQTFIVREEMIGRIVGPGRFDSLDSMKTAHELIQEVSRRPAVVKQVLKKVGPPGKRANPNWEPDRDEIESLQNAITFYAPGGAELGKTEMLSMKVKSLSPERAEALVKALFEVTRNEVRAIRQRKAESMVEEVGHAVNLARERVTESNNKLQGIESGLGRDLLELRNLNEPYSAGGELTRSLADIQSEARATITQRDTAIQLMAHLEPAINNPEQIIGTPRELLESQPALSQMKTQLIESQVRLATVGATYSPRHSLFMSAEKAVEDIRLQINRELANVMLGLESQRSLAEQKLESLNERVETIRKRMDKIATMRVEYQSVQAELESRNQEFAESHKEYLQAESILRASDNVDFLTAMDEAQAANRPLGPTRKAILIGAAIAGLMIGLGLVMLATPPPNLFPPRSGVTPSSEVTPRSGVTPSSEVAVSEVAVSSGVVQQSVVAASSGVVQQFVVAASSEVGQQSEAESNGPSPNQPPTPIQNSSAATVVTEIDQAEEATTVVGQEPAVRQAQRLAAQQQEMIERNAAIQRNAIAEKQAVVSQQQKLRAQAEALQRQRAMQQKTAFQQKQALQQLQLQQRAATQPTIHVDQTQPIPAAPTLEEVEQTQRLTESTTPPTPRVDQSSSGGFAIPDLSNPSLPDQPPSSPTQPS